MNANRAGNNPTDINDHDLNPAIERRSSSRKGLVVVVT
jgi:hypothetical protein